MAGGMFVISEGGDLVSLTPTPFAKEVDFQRLIEAHPELLSGDLIEPGAPRRWILIRSEMSVPLEARTASGLSLDDLFIDQDGVPTLVEVKRASDSRLRREVVAQMLDYAANAVVYWPPGDLRSQFENRLEIEGKDPERELQERLGLSPDEIEGFWLNVATNLRSGRIRMLFVADEIPAELRRIVEFLNEQMSPAVVLALELRHFTGGNIKTLVPVVFGQTQRAVQEKKVSSARSKMGIGDLIQNLKALVSADTTQAMDTLFDFASVKPLRLRSQGQSLFVGCKNNFGQAIEPFAFCLDGKIWAQLDDTHMKPPFDDPQKRALLREKLSRIEGIELSNRPLFPTTPLDQLTANSIDGLKQLLTWIKAEAQGS
jgi:hypothetical protein